MGCMGTYSGWAFGSPRHNTSSRAWCKNGICRNFGYWLDHSPCQKNLPRRNLTLDCSMTTALCWQHAAFLWEVLFSVKNYKPISTQKISMCVVLFLHRCFLMLAIHVVELPKILVLEYRYDVDRKSEHRYKTRNTYSSFSFSLPHWSIRSSTVFKLDF